LLRLLTAGSVDDGKSTLIGRLLHDTGGAYDDELASVYKASAVKGHKFDPSLLTDGLKAEREQGITIDVAYRYFSTPRRKFIIADTPGHEQYTRNMVTGASTADLAILLIDARKGVLPQTRRHLYVAWMLGIRSIVLALNKMDLVQFSQDVFEDVKQTFLQFTSSLDFQEIHVVPVSALDGDNITARSTRMPWYQGAPLLEILETSGTHQVPAAGALRFPVQMVIRPNQDIRAYAGQIASGLIKPGMEVMALPSRERARVDQVFLHTQNLEGACSPMSVAVSLKEHIDLGRGDILCDPRQAPPESKRLSARLIWMSATPLRLNEPYLAKHATQTVCLSVTELENKIDVNTLDTVSSDSLHLNEIGEVKIETHKPIFCDPYSENRTTGSFILIDPVQNTTVGVGIISQTHSQDPAGAPAPRSTRAVRAADGHCGLTVWLTGLSGSGKTTICQAVHTELLARSLRTEVLDGDVVRRHLCRDLGFSKRDRDENIRRIGYVAQLLSRNGVIVLVSAIAPYRELRDEVRASIGNFLEVYVNAPLEVCENRDPKGLYKRARAGEFRGFTGIDDPYEPPLNPEVECRTSVESVKESVDKVVEAILKAI
jgi:bifunctional enzyme CysN/CysC